MNHKTKSFSYALLELSKEDKKLEKRVDYLLSLEESLCSEDAHLFFGNNSIDLEKKKKVLSTLTKDQILINWLLLIIMSREYSQIEYIIEKFLLISSSILKLKIGTIWITEKILPKYKETLIKKLTKKHKQKIILREKYDLNLISGIKLIIDDLVLDFSVKNKIEKLTKILLEEKR